MADVFYRVHWADCPPLTADNAWSALWGTRRTAGGTQTHCVACNGTGDGTRRCPDCNGIGWNYDNQPCSRCDGDGDLEGCESCDGDGVHDCQRGYSCFADAQSLIGYFAARPGTVDPDDTVVVFEGDYQGAGFDGEDLAVPTRIVETVSWSAFLARMS